ncbi:methyl-accepting chemotaxis protein [Mameliella sediminis]|uniref:methyl-accepting chemotaxis protein n=1 Tax=Mameliella sediminis TaxID=2836866 RepID=UPI001FE4A1EF|nr:methyl-accepting chemotaxis protein [Mameliella sediminis]
MNTLFSQLWRMDGRVIAVVVSVLVVPLAWLVILSSGQVPGMLIHVLPVAAILAALSTRGGHVLGGYGIATMLILQAVVVTAEFSGHPWQTDTHLIFFAVLAVVSTLGSVPVLAWACGLTAVHLFGVGTVWPALVWPVGEGGSILLRGLLHLAVVLLEGGVLATSMIQRKKARERLAQTNARLETERRMAADAQAEAEASNIVAQEVIAQVRVALTRLSGRDMTCRIDQPFPEAYEIMREDFNTTVETLRDSFLSANALAGSFTTDAQGLAQDMIALSGQSGNQVDRLAEMTTAATQLLQAFEATVQEAKQAASAAGQARASAERIGTVTTQAITAMRGIEDSSREISQIVDLIDDVAFQTNLLALNAGVEAARAGPSGKGFAVVAAEVRHLAQSTSEAAAGIRSLITRSSEQVTTGAELVDAVGNSLDEIMERIARTSEMTDAIATRNADQAGAMTGLHNQIQQADGETRRVSERSRQLASTSRRMTIASKKLSCDIEAFTFTEEDLMRGMAEV